ncbi:MAG: glycosyltransferase family 39 protein [Myxococcota bacterium]|jgi:4-amino-4-deoxy-L-arabinose transferase-like glycosyltransferase|nr:glycosyltransferase family 39 protein [Myxococcota bacterium]
MEPGVKATDSPATGDPGATAPAGAALERPPEQQEWLAIAGIWFVAIMLRLFHLLAIRQHDPFFFQPAVDPRFYHEWATRIAAGDWLGSGVFLQGPLYPYLLSLLYRVTGPDLFWPRFVNAVMGSLACVLVWWIARSLFDRRVALLAAALVALHGMFIFYEGSLLIANVLIPLNLLVVACALKAQNSERRALWFALGALIGLSALGRPNMLLFAPLIAIALVWHRAEAMRRVALLACLVAGVALVLAPGLMRNRAVADDWVLVSASAGMNFFNGNNADANGSHNVPSIFDRAQADHPAEQNAIYRAYAEERLSRSLRPSEVSDYWFDRGLDWVKAHPGDWLALMARKFLLFVNHYEIWNNRSYEVSSQFSWVLRLPLVSFGFIAPLAVLGMVLAASRYRELWPLYGVVAVALATGLIFFVLSRYRVPAVPALIIFAAAALVWLYDALRARRREFYFALASLVVFIGVSSLDLHVQDLSVAYYNLGNRYRLAHDHERAIEQYRRSLEINSSYISAHNNLALSLELSGRHREEAIEAWRYLGELGRARGLTHYVERAERHLSALEGS